MNVYKAKYKVLHLAQSHPKHQYRLKDEWLESSAVENDLGALIDKKLNLSCIVLLQSRKPVLSGTTQKEMWPAC